MHRRHFLQLTGTTLAGMLTRNLTFAAPTGNRVMNPPDEVYFRQGTQWYQLTSSNGTHYIYKDIQVDVRQDHSALSAWLQSPGMPAEAIMFYWKIPIDFTGKCLGDHWERSYGDLAWKTPDIPVNEPWYVLVKDDRQVSGFGVKTGAASICSWNLRLDGLTLTMDVRSGGSAVALGDRRLHMADIITIQNSPSESVFDTTRRFCSMMCEQPRLPKQPVYGINDWYFAYGNNSADLILRHTSTMAALAGNSNNRPFSVIDDGWAAFAPAGGWEEDFSRPNDKFRDMKKVADDIKGLGMRPGLWTRPLVAKQADKKNLLLPLIPGRSNPANPILDPTIEENLERIKRNFSIYRNWGYDLVKHDYTTYDLLGKWGFQMQEDITTPGWRFYDNTKTTAEVISNLYSIIRQSAGDMYLIGCNTISHLSAGVFELNRIGDDTSGKEWARTRKMGVNTLAFRMPQHKHFYEADADCVGLTTLIPWEKNRQWMQLLAESSTPLFISAQPEALGSEQKAFVKQCFAKAAQPQPIGQPLDWLTNPYPAKWRLDNREVEFDWS